MDLQNILIQTLSYLALMVSGYAIFDAPMNHWTERQRLDRNAKVNLHVSDIMATYSIHQAAQNFLKFEEAFKRAGLSDDATRKRKLLVEAVGVSVSDASARFAAFEADQLWKEDATHIHQENLHLLFNNLKEIYMKVDDLTAEEAEQRMIEESMLAIADLDAEDKIVGNVSLRNPAKSYFHNIVTMNKDRKS